MQTFALMALADRTYVDHGHVTWSFVAVGIGVLLFLLGLARKVLLLAGLAVVLTIAGVVTGVVSLHGTHCTPGSTRSVCVSGR